MSIYPETIKALTEEYAAINEIENTPVAFQRMTTDLVLRQYNLLPEDLNDGDVDGYMDGGLDGFYIFVNGVYVDDEDKIAGERIRHNPRIEVYLIQNKYTGHFAEDAVLKLSNIANRILDEEDDMSGVKEPVRRKKKLFHAIWKSLLTKMPTPEINLVYITNADPNRTFPSVIRTAESHERQLEAKNANSVRVAFRLINSLEIYNLKKIGISYTKELVTEHRITTDSAEIVTATLDSYYNFITQSDVTDASGVRDIATHLFEDNVRDFQGDVTVNRNIVETLEDANSKEFWWYNNGITIVCSEATAKGRTLTLKDIQIVNGLQTSYCIYNTKSSNPDIANFDKRHILIKVIVTDDSSIRDSVIKATNSQTAVSAWSLHATDRIQRLIEDYFKTEGLYYDRRKGYHKNSGRPIAKIVSINYVGQCMIAMGLSQPDTARARPNSFLSKEEQYKRVFDDTIGLNLYLLATRFQKRVEGVIRAKQELKEHFTDIRFYVSSFICTYLKRGAIHSPKGLSDVKDDLLAIDDEAIERAADITIGVLTELSAGVKSNFAKVAKSKEFRNEVIQRAIDLEQL